MLVKVLMIGESGIGKTHTCVEVSKVIKSVIIDVDNGAEPIIQKLNAEETVQRLDGTPYTTFLQSLKLAIKSDAEMIIIDSLTELKEVIKRHIKDKILKKGEFFIGGVERETPKRIADPDLFVLTWELHPAVYDNIRDIMRAINSAGKSFIVTYHPPAGDKVSQGEAKILSELIRITDIVVQVTQDDIMIKKDRFFNLKRLSKSDFIEYLRRILQAKHINEVKDFVDSLIL